MKYRIVQLKNGQYQIQRKKGWINPWEYVDQYESLETARKFLNEILADRRNDKEKEIGRKIARVIEEFEV